MKSKILIFVLILSFLFAFTGLTSFAQTKAKSTPTTRQPKLDDKRDPLRIGVRDINKHQVNFYSLEKEIKFGQQLAAQLDAQLKLADDSIICEYINRIGQNIVLHSDAKVPFTIKVVASDEINAFSLPGGYLYVNAGLIAATDTEAELAGVMAHEIAHVAARHAMEQMSKGQLFSLLASLPAIFVGGAGGAAGRIALPLLFAKFSRVAEEEADLLGAQYVWAAGYDPEALGNFLEKLKAKEKKNPNLISKVFASHPPSSDRMQKVREQIKLFPEREEYLLSSSEFNRVHYRLEPLIASNKAVSSSNQGGDVQQQPPTLKRRPQTGEKREDQEKKQSGEEKREPTLKRRQPNP